MDYASLVSEYIEKSGMSLSEIVRKMELEKGVKVDRSYLSMLKNNKTKNPASDEINRAFAEITGGDASDLVLAGYYEKAPSEVKDLINRTKDYEAFFEKLLKIVDFNIEVEGDEEGTKNFASHKDTINSPHFFVNLSPETRNLLLYAAFEEIATNDPKRYRDVLRTLEEDSDPKVKNSSSQREIPVIGTICAGDGLLAEQNIEDYVLYPITRGRQPEYALHIQGDSMSGAGINEGDVVYLRAAPWAEYNGQIVAALINDEQDGVLKRMRWSEGSPTIRLIPENPKYEEIHVLPHQIRICGVYMGHFTPIKEERV